ncbi:hypothetical protein [Aminipila terrae]|uniref:Uncharacterized protein n=1 Tax=Aminipila terrae TaxID=2697030 RepID=A0A6P1MLF7_9FIRM|nr:hypothetical protein [Aminipila terrae]QHI72486.1 hypothetical protein Ami3637_08840 [Aminipila terrae]
MSAGTWILKYDMHGYITNGENINAYVEYENVTKLPLEICKVISLEGKNTERLERVCVENNENTYKVNTYVKTKRIDQVDSISNIIIFKLFKLIPLVKITKVTYHL